MTTVRGIPTTTVTRTLLDLAAVLDERALRRAINEAVARRLVAFEALTTRLPTGRGGFRGRAQLARILANSSGPTRSVLEDNFLALIARSRLPAPEINRRIAGFEVDVLWREARVIVELDGRAFHDNPDAFERDRARDARLAAAGYRVVRITWRRLAQHPDREAALLARMLTVGAPG